MPDPKSRADEILSRTRHGFLLSPCTDVAFTRCPKCEEKTRQRKVPLVIHHATRRGAPDWRRGF